VALPPKDDIERTLREIVGVEAVRVCLAGEGIAELHIAASPGSRAKNVMRDVRSCLAAVLGIEVDHKKISIAVRKSPGGHPETPSGEGEGMRVRFHSVSVLIEGLQTEVQVRLAAQGRDLLGCASGWGAEKSWLPRSSGRAGGASSGSSERAPWRRIVCAARSSPRWTP
jgi:hypothetical protein